MKAVLSSIRPEWLRKILNGSKTVEIRVTNWDHFSRRFTGIEVERAMEDKKDG